MQAGNTKRTNHDGHETISFIISLMISYLTGNAQNVVDVHCHNIPPFYMEALENTMRHWTRVSLYRSGTSILIWHLWIAQA